MEDAKILFSHFVTVDIPKGNCYSSEHLDTGIDPFHEGAQWCLSDPDLFQHRGEPHMPLHQHAWRLCRKGTQTLQCMSQGRVAFLCHWRHLAERPWNVFLSSFLKDLIMQGEMLQWGSKSYPITAWAGASSLKTDHPVKAKLKERWFELKSLLESPPYA